ncbi:MAG: hypothetical protein NVSMB46_02020 [Candidatus Saccharimonadales bacterium]
MIEDSNKVKKYLHELNHGADGPWFAADGFNIWLGFEFGKNGQSNTINGSSEKNRKCYL